MGGEHHIATVHGPMVQGRLLTHHPGGVHGGGKVPVVILPSSRVPGRVLLALPIWEARRRRNRDAIVEKGSRPEGFETCFKYTPKGGVRGPTGFPGGPTARPGGGRATRSPRRLVAPLRLSFGVPEGSETLIFYIFFLEFF